MIDTIRVLLDMSFAQVHALLALHGAKLSVISMDRISHGCDVHEGKPWPELQRELTLLRETMFVTTVLPDSPTPVSVPPAPAPSAAAPKPPRGMQVTPTNRPIVNRERPPANTTVFQTLGRPPTPPVGALGEHIEQLVRTKFGGNRSALAQKAGLTPSRLSETIRGITTPSVNTLQKIAHAAGVDARPLIDLLSGITPVVDAPPAPGADIPKPLLRSDDLAVWLRVSPQRVLELAQAGHIPSPMFIPNLGPRWQPAEIDAWRAGLKNMPIAANEPVAKVVRGEVGRAVALTKKRKSRVPSAEATKLRRRIEREFGDDLNRLAEEAHIDISVMRRLVNGTGSSAHATVVRIRAACDRLAALKRAEGWARKSEPRTCQRQKP